jgi:hypothetical protein
MERPRDFFRGEMVLANISAQRTECCGKTYKNRMLHLFSFMKRDFNSYDMIIEETSVMFYHYHDTLSGGGNRKCSAFHQPGHNNNSSDCKLHHLYQKPGGDA